jgi:hypothetical protein
MRLYTIGIRIKQSHVKRTLIGRVDMETSAIIPTDGRMKKPEVQRFPER